MAISSTLLGTAAVAGTAASAAVPATAGLIGFGGSISTLGVLSALSTGFGIASSISGLRAQSKEAKYAAREAETQAEMEQLKGLQEGNEIRRQLIRDQSEIIAQGQGGAPIAQLTGGVASRAGRAMNVVDFNSQLAAKRLRTQAAYYRASKPSIWDYAGATASAAMPAISAAMER